MTIQTGDKVPSCTLKTMGAEGPTDISTADIFSGKKVLLFAVPGAFTPGCSMTHMPGYVVNADKIKAAGVDTIVCMAVNDAFVMGAWGEAQRLLLTVIPLEQKRSAMAPFQLLLFVLVKIQVKNVKIIRGFYQ